MAIMIKSKLDQKQISYTSWLVTTITNLIRKPIKVLSILLLTFKQTQEADLNNINILVVFDGNLGEAIKPQQGIVLDCGL